MLPLANSLDHCFNPNLAKNKSGASPAQVQLNPNHRVCQSGDKATINVKKANLQY